MLSLQKSKKLLFNTENRGDLLLTNHFWTPTWRAIGIIIIRCLLVISFWFTFFFTIRNVQGNEGLLLVGTQYNTTKVFFLTPLPKNKKDVSNIDFRKSLQLIIYEISVDGLLF